MGLASQQLLGRANPVSETTSRHLLAYKDRRKIQGPCCQGLAKQAQALTSLGNRSSSAAERVRGKIREVPPRRARLVCSSLSNPSCSSTSN